MNFDFLRDLRGLSDVFNPCKDAEELVKTKPYLSITASRKSAELLAKFIYLAAHSEEMEGLTFADILSDAAVRNYIHDKTVMDAFHYIRKSGNKAVHGDDRASSDDAIAVLRNLHYVAGETACEFGLINQYPDFEPNISEYPNASFQEIPDINEKAKEMFLAYVGEFHAQMDRDQYEQSTFDYAIEGIFDMHEYIEFEQKPKLDSTIAYLQDYFCHLSMLAMERSAENAPDLWDPVKLKTVLTINGEQRYSSDNPEEFVDGLMNMLPSADRFVIDSYCEGNLRQYLDVTDSEGKEPLNQIRKDALWNGAGMLDKLQSLKRREKFIYKLAVFYPNSGELKHEKIDNGREVDVLRSGSTNIIHAKFAQEWWCWSLNLVVRFDFDAHPDILEQLHETVKKHIPKSEVGYCEETWEDGEPGILASGIQWITQNLCEIQTFLDEINRIIMPIKDECDCGADGIWEIKDQFAVATWNWFEDGFKVVGTMY